MLDLHQLRAAESGWQINAFQKQSIIAFCTQARSAYRPVWWLPYLIKPLIGVGIAAATAFVLLLVWPLIRQEPGRIEITAGAPGNSDVAQPDEYIENPEQPSGSEEPNTPQQDPEENPVVTPPADTEEPEDPSAEESDSDEDRSYYVVSVDFFSAQSDAEAPMESADFEALLGKDVTVKSSNAYERGGKVYQYSLQLEFYGAKTLQIVEKKLTALSNENKLNSLYYNIYFVEEKMDEAPILPTLERKRIVIGGRYYTDGYLEVELPIGHEQVTYKTFEKLPVEAIFVWERSSEEVDVRLYLTSRGEEAMLEAARTLRAEYGLDCNLDPDREPLVAPELPGKSISYELTDFDSGLYYPLYNEYATAEAGRSKLFVFESRADIERIEKEISQKYAESGDRKPDYDYYNIEGIELTDAYFEEKVLLIVSSYEPSTAHSLKMVDLKNENGAVTVWMEERCSVFGGNAITERTFLIEVKKADLPTNAEFHINGYEMDMVG